MPLGQEIYKTSLRGSPLWYSFPSSISLNDPQKFFEKSIVETKNKLYIKIQKQVKK